MDVARKLTADGHHASALRYVNAAIGLAPNSRFVVRGAARYFLHVGDHERAHDLLKRTELIRFDPWIQASEIAVATLRERSSLMARRATREIAKTGALDVRFSELASALGIIEILSGAEKKAKQLFHKALGHPNDNSLAQAEWAAARL